MKNKNFIFIAEVNPSPKGDAFIDPSIGDSKTATIIPCKWRCEDIFKIPL